MSTSSPERDCCGISAHHWASLSSLTTSLYFVGVSIASFWTFSYVRTQAEVTTAEGNDEAIWNNPRIVSITLALFFLVLALLSASLSFLTTYKATTSPRSTRSVWTVVVVVGVFVVGWAVAGAIMSFGTAKDAIELACRTIDDECFANYVKLEWYSIVVRFLPLVSGLVDPPH
ncbi:hypothetical protein JCM10212_001372 [Sporobolomyces blumeae]